MTIRVGGIKSQAMCFYCFQGPEDIPKHLGGRQDGVKTEKSLSVANSVSASASVDVSVHTLLGPRDSSLKNSYHEYISWANKIAQFLSEVAAKPEDLSSMPRAHVVEGEI